jgi:erythromycin esterase-like protein
MSGMTETALTDAIRHAARPLAGDASDHDALLDLVGDRRLVLLGEGSHGTHEFYAARVEITRRLIEERGFDAVAVEGDWPDSDRVNRWVRGRGGDGDASAALGGFRRFPQWMWRNHDVVALADALRAHNASVGRARAVGFYGLDLYSLHASIDEVLRYLDEVDPEAARRARYRYGCFEHFGEDPQEYGHAASFDLSRSCEDEVVQQLVELRRSGPVLRAEETGDARDEEDAADDFFSAEQNARLVLDAERYYRSMFRGRASSWNLRDTHMADTLDALVAHLRGRGRAGKVVVWAHNSHLGDARATEMGAGGEINLGQLARERHADDAVLVGFTTHAGTVTAAHDWGDPAQTMRVNPSLPGSIERALHDAAPSRAAVPLRGSEPADALRALLEQRALLERAIGVIYRPRTERQSHYFHARVGRQFDLLYHFDESRAVEPLDRAADVVDAEPPETYPSAL